MVLVVPQIGICFLVTNRLAELTDRHSIAVLFESAVRSAIASLRVTSHEHPYHCPARQSFATFPSRHDPSPLNVNNNTRSFSTPTAGPHARPPCGETPPTLRQRICTSTTCSASNRRRIPEIAITAPESLQARQDKTKTCISPPLSKNGRRDALVHQRITELRRV